MGGFDVKIYCRKLSSHIPGNFFRRAQMLSRVTGSREDCALFGVSWPDARVS